MRDRHTITLHVMLTKFREAARLADIVYPDDQPRHASERRRVLEAVVMAAMDHGDLAAAQDICETFPREIGRSAKDRFAREMAWLIVEDDDRTVIADASETYIYVPRRRHRR